MDIKSVVNDYINWKKHNKRLLDSLTSNTSMINSRWIHSYSILEHISSISEKRQLSFEEENIIQVAFEYLSERIEYLDLIYTRIFGGVFSEMILFAETIHLLLYITEFEEELQTRDPDNTEGYKRIFDFGQDVLVRLERKEHCIGYIEEFNILAGEVLANYSGDFYLIADIFYDTAEHYDLIDYTLDDSDDEDLIN